MLLFTGFTACFFLSRQQHADAALGGRAFLRKKRTHLLRAVVAAWLLCRLHRATFLSIWHRLSLARLKWGSSALCGGSISTVDARTPGEGPTKHGLFAVHGCRCGAEEIRNDGGGRGSGHMGSPPRHPVFFFPKQAHLEPCNTAGTAHSRPPIDSISRSLVGVSVDHVWRAAPWHGPHTGAEDVSAGSVDACCPSWLSGSSHHARGGQGSGLEAGEMLLDLGPARFREGVAEEREGRERDPDQQTQDTRRYGI